MTSQIDNGSDRMHWSMTEETMESEFLVDTAVDAVPIAIIG